MGSRKPVCALLFFLSLASTGRPQAASPSTAPSAPPQINVGRALVRLYGPWKFQVGDSPADPGTGAPLWAAPGFDDSSWETVDLTPAAGAFDPVAGMANYVPGWTDKGHPRTSGYAWYRIRVHVSADSDVPLAIAGPSDVDDAYQLFANGTLLGSFGTFREGATPTALNTQPRMFSLPRKGTADTQVLAFRVWMAPVTAATQPGAGGFHSAPTIGEAAAIGDRYQLEWLQVVRAYGSSALLVPPFIVSALIAISLIVFDPTDRTYRWLAVVFALTASRSIILMATAWGNLGGFATTVLLGMIAPLTLGSWLMVWWTWFSIRRPEWMPKLIAALTVSSIVSTQIGQDLFFGILPHSVAVSFHVVSLAIRLCLLVLLIFIVDRGIRTQGNDGWLALPAVILMGIAQFQVEIALLHVRTTWFPFGLQVTLSTIAQLFLLGVMMVLLFRRLLLSLRRQREIALDMKHAQEVQRVLLPEPVTIPWLRIESEYRPASEVGGDFFQIIPDSRDGSLLIVAGDVAGKGLQAGMLVALLVGAMRSTLEWTSEPKLLLEALNRRLLGRAEAHATCLALHITPDGSAALANAGHLPPYLNGIEVQMDGALPLGTMPGADFSVTHFHIAPGDTLTLISDGIVEAQDKDHGLFGFERVRDLLRSNVSAAALASAAQTFGQEDDISVVAVTRFA